MNAKWLAALGVAANVIGLLTSVVSGWTEERMTSMLIDKKIAAALDNKNEEEEENEDEEES